MRFRRIVPFVGLFGLGAGVTGIKSGIGVWEIVGITVLIISQAWAFTIYVRYPTGKRDPP